MQVVEAIDVARGYAGVPLDALTDAGDETRKDRLAQDDVDLERVELREELRPAARGTVRTGSADPGVAVRRGQDADRDRGDHRVSQMQISRLISRSLDQLRERLSDDAASDVDANPGMTVTRAMRRAWTARGCLPARA